MRIIKDKKLRKMSHGELMRQRNLVVTNPDLTKEEIDTNVKNIDIYLNGGRECTRAKEIHDSIEAGLPDTSDMDGRN